MLKGMEPIALINGFQKKLNCLRTFQRKTLRVYVGLGLGNLFQKKPIRLEPTQGQRHKLLTNLRSTLDQGFLTLMIKDPIKVGYLRLSDPCRSVSRHPRTGSGTLIADARDT